MQNTILFFDDFMIWNQQGMRKRFFQAETLRDYFLDEKAMIGGRLLKQSDGKYLMWRNRVDLGYDEISNLSIMESENLLDWSDVSSKVNAEEYPRSAVIKDAFEPDETRRYKTAYIIRDGTKGKGYISTAPNAFELKTDKKHNFCNHISDSINNVFYNPVTKEYQVILRGGFIDRRICCVTSEDLNSWSKPKMLLVPSPEEEPGTEYYGMIVFPQNGYFIAHLWKYLTPHNDTANTKMAGKSDSYIAYSYDGFSWNILHEMPSVSRPLPPEHGCAGIYLNSLEDFTDGKSWVMTGDIRRIDHGCGFKPVYPESEIPDLAKEEGFSAVGFYKIRKEGFAALETLAIEGEVVTKRIVPNCDELFANICAPLGWAQFQLIDENGPIKGFEYRNCIMLKDQDDVRFPIRWKNKTLSELKGKSVKLAIRMNTALLFSITGDFGNHIGYYPTESLGNPTEINV